MTEEGWTPRCFGKEFSTDMFYGDTYGDTCRKCELHNPCEILTDDRRHRCDDDEGYTWSL